MKKVFFALFRNPIITKIVTFAINPQKLSYMNNDELAVLSEYENAIEASMVKGVLETNGVPAMLTNEIMSTVLSLAPINYGMVRVLVFRRHLDLARKILASSSINPDTI